MKHIALKFISISALAINMAGCYFPPPTPPLTPLQIQVMQTTTFQADKDKIFNATTTALQNMGYTIQNMSKASGSLRVTGPARSSMIPGPLVYHQKCRKIGKHDSKFCYSSATHGPSTAVTTINTGSITIRPVGKDKKQASVRLNFIAKSKKSSHQGQSSESDSQIHDPKFYQNFFNQIRQSLFIGGAAE